MEIRRVIVEEGVVCMMMMILMEGITIGLTIMASTIMSRGMSPFVFVVYTNALSSFFLLPYSFSFYTQIRENPLVSTFSLLMRFFFLGLTGVTIAQNLAFVGLSYSSPIMACGMANLIPSFTFLLSIISRKTKIEWRGSSFIAKLGGTLISIMGAISLAFYKGPVIKYSPSHDILRLSQTRLFIFTSPHENWILGAILMAAASFSVSIWNIIQVQTLKKYQEVMTIVSFYSLFGTIQTAIFSLLIERNSNAWKLKLNMDLLVIVATATFSSVVRSRVQIWCMRKKGPFYAPMFKPAGIPIATIYGCLFFASTFHYGSIMGAFIVGVGTYLVMWGQLIEDEVQKTTSASDLQEEKTPLLEADGQV